ncbi:TIGR03758 family integrating conjugative element protein [Pantoea sp. RG18]|uniref:TIGR03758 family integrating conjugative element protein n=1 Tax=Pantoea sp. RG18 TaxID=2981603 RepID=UPI0022207365|nr:TIGR03758 family integrating conjugative element protein [Pantoea sp. RG18]MCW0938427.1 TIGR03758 family integrating conjugative element protein [Pantoea sp. RG18]
MAMTAAQINAFKTASGNIDIRVLYLVSVRPLLCVLFLWGAWAKVDVWHSWANTKVRGSALARFVIRSVALLIFCI